MKIMFDCFWNWNHWYIIPTISLDRYVGQFDIHFFFMGLFFEIAFMKQGGL